MSTSMRGFLAALSLAVAIYPCAIAAQTFPPQGGAHRHVNLDDVSGGSPLLNNVALNAQRCFNVPLNRVASMGLLVLWLDYTYATTGTLTGSCKGDRHRSTATSAPYRLQACLVGETGKCTQQADAATVATAVTQTDKFQMAFNVLGAANVTCCATHSAGTSSDKLTARGDLYAF
jgi:hypothetical protein